MAETGIRYQKDARVRRPKTEPQLRQEIIQVCRLLWQRGLVSATDGNVSVRLHRDRFLCTPSGFSKGLVSADELIVVDWEGSPVGPRFGPQADLLPSSEMLTHLEAYRIRPDVQAVVHAHPPITVALSIAGISLAQCLLPEVVLAFGLIPTTDYATPSSAQGAEVIRRYVDRYDALVLRRHGTLTLGGSALEAYLKVEKVEATAEITRTLVTLGRVPPLPPEEVRRLVAWREAQGLVKPGHAEDLCQACGFCSPASTPRP